MDNEIQIKEWKNNSIMDLEEIIRFQILLYCHLYSVRITDTQLRCLTLIGLWGNGELKLIAVKFSELKLFSSQQSARNTIALLENKHLIIKQQDKRKKRIKLHPDMQIQTEGNIFVDVNCLCRENKSDV